MCCIQTRVFKFNSKSSKLICFLIIFNFVRSNFEKQIESCFVPLYNGVPNYQHAASNNVDCSGESFDRQNLEFSPEKCRLKMQHTDWNKTLYINVTGVSDSIVNKADRIVFLRLYTTEASAAKKKILSIWNTITLPDIKVSNTGTRETL